MSRHRHTPGPLLGWSQYLAFRAARTFFRLLPRGLARAAGRGLGGAAWTLLGKRRGIALENVERVHGAEGRAIAARSFRHFGEVMVEMMWADRLFRAGEWEKRVEFVGREHLDRAVAAKKGVLCVGAHFGNWEIGGYVMSMLGYPVHAIERPLRNPRVHAHLARFRQATGQKTIEKEGAMREMIRVVRAGEIVALLADQDARRDGIYVDFLGRQASTHRAPATLSLKYGASIVTFAVPKIGKGRYRIHFDEPFVAEATGDNEADIRKATQRYTSAIERHVRERPDQWLWMHRRWKTQPKPPKSAEAPPASREEIKNS